jgi:hypothetical protein
MVCGGASSEKELPVSVMPLERRRAKENKQTDAVHGPKY